jgi:hypothetical protein
MHTPSHHSPTTRLRNAARLLGRLRPDWQNPESYFENRDELERELKAIARQMEGRHHG